MRHELEDIDTFRIDGSSRTGGRGAAGETKTKNRPPTQSPRKGKMDEPTITIDPAEKLKQDHSDRMKAIEKQLTATATIKMALTDLHVEDAIQPRAEIHERVVAQLAQTALAKAEDEKDVRKKGDIIASALDPIECFEMGLPGKGREKKIVVVSGHTRKRAIAKAFSIIDPEKEFFGSPYAMVKVLKGMTVDQALEYAPHANTVHKGAMMIEKDYERAARNLILHDPRESQRSIAAKLGGIISHVTVGRIKRDMLEEKTITPADDGGMVKTTSGRIVKKRVPKGRDRTGYRQMNGRPVPVSIEHLWADTSLAEFADSLEAFVKRIFANDPNFGHLPMNICGELNNLRQIVLDSRPGNACPACEDKENCGCGECNSTGFLPVRDCYDAEDEKRKK